VSKLIMLDFDGVIADSLEVTAAATIKAMKEHGYVHLTSQEAVLRLAESNWFEGLRKAGVPHRVSDDIDDLVANAASAGELEPYATMGDVIAQLAERHRILIVTSNRTDIVEAFLTRWNIVGVREVLGGDKGKSKVRKIRAAVRRHADAEGSWFVGDTVGDIVEGKKAGVGTIAAAWGWHSLEQLRSASPDRIAGAPSDLLALLL
jgi:phosphoglycolate phosphatase